NPAKILVRRRRLARFALHAVSKLSENIAVHVADMRDAGGVSVRLEPREMSVTAPVQSDHRKVESIIGTGDSAIALCRTAHRQPRRAHCKCIEKLSSCNHFLIPHNFLIAGGQSRSGAARQHSSLPAPDSSLRRRFQGASIPYGWLWTLRT